MKRFLPILLLTLCCARISSAATDTPAAATPAVAVPAEISPAQAATLRREIDAITSRLEADYRINIFTDYVPRASSNINANVVTPEGLPRLREYIGLMEGELRKYSPRFIRNTRLSSLIVVENLMLGEQRRSTIPEGKRRNLWLDFNYYKRRPGYENHVFHHELYHLIEYELHGTSYYKDPQWSAFNDPDFRYGQGGGSTYGDKSKPWSALIHPLPGFIDWYSTTGLEEDKAEIYAALWIQSERQQMLEWARTDPILRAKISYFKGKLRELDPSLDEAYWNRLDEVKLPVAPDALPAAIEANSR